MSVVGCKTFELKGELSSIINWDTISLSNYFELKGELSLINYVNWDTISLSEILFMSLLLLIVQTNSNNNYLLSVCQIIFNLKGN